MRNLQASSPSISWRGCEALPVTFESNPQAHKDNQRKVRQFVLWFAQERMKMGITTRNLSDGGFEARRYLMGMGEPYLQDLWAQFTIESMEE